MEEEIVPLSSLEDKTSPLRPTRLKMILVPFQIYYYTIIREGPMLENVQFHLELFHLNYLLLFYYHYFKSITFYLYI